MAVRVGSVQPVQVTSGVGYGFTISDDKGHNHITVSYATEKDAQAALEQVKSAFENAIEAAGPVR